jgi:hypothetical protein
MSGVTDDRNDPGLKKIDDRGMQDKYLVLSDEELAKGFVRPVRRSYVHETCGTKTTMGLTIAETYARDPHFYGATYCVACREHFPVGPNGHFRWIEADGLTGPKVGM